MTFVRPCPVPWRGQTRRGDGYQHRRQKLRPGPDGGTLAAWQTARRRRAIAEPHRGRPPAPRDLTRSAGWLVWYNGRREI